MQPNDIGFALVGLPLPLPVALGGGQFVHFGIVGALFLGAVVPDPNGEWSVGIPLPNDPSLAGLDLVAQPLFVSSTQPVGVDLGDAWWVTLGF